MLSSIGSMTLKRIAAGLFILALTGVSLRPMPDVSAQEISRVRQAPTSSQVSTLPSTQGQNEQAEVPTDQIIIKYRAMSGAFNLPKVADQMQRLDTAAGTDLEYVREMSEDAHILRLPQRLPFAQVQAISDRLKALPEVEYAEPDQILFPALTPNDSLYSGQWDLFETNGINATAAWDFTTGDSSIMIADIDTGITDHADLSGRSVPGYDFISDVLVANDGNGRDADPSDPGDWITQAEHDSGYFKNCTVTNSSWHGTHTAGTIGAKSNNSMGVTGINWNSMLLPVRVLGKCGGYTSDIVDGLRWSAGLSVSGVPANPNPARVANLSLGGTGTCGTTWQNGIDAVIAAGMVVVVAAGNKNADASNFSPAGCNGVITVAATDRNGNRAYYSNYGATVEISAPGGAQGYTNDPNGILSTLNTGTKSPVADTYTYYQGTSMAAPHVTGVVSLMLSLDPTLTPAQVLQILQATARPFPGGSTCNTSICGSGLLNAAAAVRAASPQPTISRFSPSCGFAGETVIILGSNFSDATEVSFNNIPTSFDILSDTIISATVPEGVTTGPIRVTNPDGTATSTIDFYIGVCYSIDLPLVIQ
jgi:serine protease